jgi:hypothetical protein
MLGLLLYVVLVVLIGYLAVWILGHLAPGHPPFIDNIIWVIVVVVVVITLANAFGLADTPVPRLR